ncbi:leucine dehydrogenase, partial [Bacillus sp. JR_15]
ISNRDAIPTYKAADRLAEERIERMRKSRSQFLQNGQHILSRR